MVADLATYPRWLEIVPRADPDADGGWTVDLRGRLGPFARSKRLRMERTVAEAPRLAVFERAERDGRHHSPWVLRAEVEADRRPASRLTMHLHYGGSLWGPVLERLLGDTIERSRPAAPRGARLATRSRSTTSGRGGARGSGRARRSPTATLAVSTSSSGPASTTRPARSRRTWVDPGRDLVDVVGHEHRRRRRRVGRERGRGAG